jgi:hypothetical protein
MEAAMVDTPTTHVCIWHEPNGWFWDVAEDHGGFDRCVAEGPFPSEDAALADAVGVFDTHLHALSRSTPKPLPG